MPVGFDSRGRALLRGFAGRRSKRQSWQEVLAGVPPRRPRRRDLEHEAQCAVIEWASLVEKREPRLRWLFAIPNGGWRSKAQAGRLKAEGVKAGVADLFLPVGLQMGATWRHGLFIEMKTETGRSSPAQRDFRDYAMMFGYAYALCRSAGEAIEQICIYLNRLDLLPR